MVAEPEVSIVIPCYNAEGTLSRQLDAILNQEFRGTFEILVADNMSNDQSKRVIQRYVEKFPIVSYVAAFGKQGINRARNCGVHAATGKVIVLCDADDEVLPGWLQALYDYLSLHPGMAGGSLDFTSNGGVFLGSKEELFGDLGFLPWPAGANCAFDREVFEQIGPFDETFLGGGDETDFFWRAQIAGFSMGFCGEARIRYFQREGWRSIFKQFVGYGQSNAKLHKKYKPHGMRNIRRYRAPIAVASALVLYCAGVRSLRLRRIAIARLGRNIGRISGSFKYRTAYF